MADYDAILIPGGGVRPEGVLPQWIVPRLDRALALAGSADFLMPLSAGTPHRPPPLDEHGFPWTEARAGARYLLEHGVPPERILLEEVSFDTIGNAYFSRVIHAIPRGFQRVLAITSAFHMERTEAIFRWVYALEAPGANCEVDFETVPNVGIDAAILAARAAKEKAALAALGPVRATIQTLAQLNLWLFTQHGAYRAAARSAPQPGEHLYS